MSKQRHRILAQDSQNEEQYEKLVYQLAMLESQVHQKVIGLACDCIGLAKSDLTASMKESMARPEFARRIKSNMQEVDKEIAAIFTEDRQVPLTKQEVKRIVMQKYEMETALVRKVQEFQGMDKNQV